MAKNAQSREANQPIWFDGKSINEALFCDDFLSRHKIIYTNGAFCYENLPPEGRNNPARPDGRLIDCISCWIRRSRAGHQVPSPMLSGVSGNYVFFYPD